MNKPTLIAIIGLLFVSISRASDSDDTLTYYRSKSDLIVLGRITSEPKGIVDEAGVPNYICDFMVTDLLKGQTGSTNNNIRVNIIQCELDPKDHSLLIKKDAECILFLKRAPIRDTPEWNTSDFWFGIQNPSSCMIRALKMLDQEMKRVEQPLSPR